MTITFYYGGLELDNGIPTRPKKCCVSQWSGVQSGQSIKYLLGMVSLPDLFCHLHICYQFQIFQLSPGSFCQHFSAWHHWIWQRRITNHFHSLRWNRREWAFAQRIKKRHHSEHNKIAWRFLYIGQTFDWSSFLKNIFNSQKATWKQHLSKV